jgi:hypothetical protein
MSKWRKKPVVIEAMRSTGEYGNAQKIIDWINQNTPGFDVLDQSTWKAWGYYNEIRIVTLEGEMAAHVGDWIIKGVKSEFYPCKPDIFEATYEAAD